MDHTKPKSQKGFVAYPYGKGGFAFSVKGDSSVRIGEQEAGVYFEQDFATCKRQVNEFLDDLQNQAEYGLGCVPPDGFLLVEGERDDKICFTLNGVTYHRVSVATERDWLA